MRKRKSQTIVLVLGLLAVVSILTVSAIELSFAYNRSIKGRIDDLRITVAHNQEES